MDTIILVPGGGGSRLTLQGTEVWPPTIPEIELFGYQRTTELRSPSVKLGTILDGIPKPIICYGVYQPIQDDLAQIAKSCGSKFVNFPYDWRKDVIASAAALAAKIKSCAKNANDEITLVCHSMGNLLARIILESGDYSGKSWFGNIKRYVGICGPHRGVPVILEYTLGLQSWLGISAHDMKTLSKDVRYPSCYQCLPFDGQHVLFDSQSGSPVEKSIYDSAVATYYDLDATNLAAATAVQGKLNFSSRPPSVDYDLISGGSHSTDNALNFNALAYLGAQIDPNGDGTIPYASSYVSPYTTITPGSHIDVLKTYPFRQILYSILACDGLTPELTLVDLPGLTISLNKIVYAPYEEIEILLVPDLRTQEISGSLQISRVVGPQARRFVRYQEQPVVYRGPQITFLRSTIAAPADPGTYRVTFNGSHGTSLKTSGAFVVSNPAAMRPRDRTRQK
jgi:Lecithin:cholesterol acyltransferase